MLHNLLDVLDQLFTAKTRWVGIHPRELLCYRQTFSFSSDVLCRWALAVIALSRRVDQVAGDL